MSNSLGRRRRNNSTSTAVDVEKIQQLEAELALLKQNYAQDMNNIGADMNELSQKIDELKPIES
jgi:predicted  nucleic acid-binding Zn-ribbon protein